MPRLKGPSLALALSLLTANAPAFGQGSLEWTGPKAWAYRQLVESVYADQPGVPLVYPEALAKTLGTQSPPLLLDSREKGEFEVSHLKGARWVGYDTFSVEALGDLPKDTPIVVYCSIGYRSGEIAGRLKDAGFQNVENLYGGMFLWFNETRPVYRDAQSIDEIHPYDWMWGRWIARGERVMTPSDSKETP